MKALKTMRFDPSDESVFDSAAGSDEWAIPGGFSFAGLPSHALEGKTRQAFANGFLSIESFGRSTFTTVADISEAEYARNCECLASHLQADYGAPSHDDAMVAARSELEFVIDLCREATVNTVFTLRRSHDENGEIREEFRTVNPSQAGSHTKIWTIVDDDMSELAQL